MRIRSSAKNKKLEGALKNNVCMVISKKATLSMFTNGLTPRERVPSNYWVGEKVNPTVGLDALENTTNFSLQHVCRTLDVCATVHR